jgi:hypothetical protein
MEISTPHGPGKVFWSLGDTDFIRAAEGLSFVPDRLLGPAFSLRNYQSSRYGELSARCWPTIHVSHALPDLRQEADGDVVSAFAARLGRILAGIPKL